MFVLVLNVTVLVVKVSVLNSLWVTKILRNFLAYLAFDIPRSVVLFVGCACNSLLINLAVNSGPRFTGKSVCLLGR